jgi:dephospho-CoA kinase
VARAIAKDGAEVLDADAIGHEVVNEDPGVRAALAAEYGPEVYRADGTLDRAQVAARVFEDPAARERLNALAHPRILERIWAALNQLRVTGYRGVVVVDAALLLDWGMERALDAVLAVIAPESEQIARLVRERGWSESDARARLAVQRSNEAFAAAADLTLDNRGTPEELERAARASVVRLLAEHRAASRDITS